MPMLGFIDVPGHERFVHTMLAGATGIDLALLVVAADDGVMPQTDEHLDILLQLGVTQGAIALTKIDAVDAARPAAVQAQLAARVRGTPAAHWPVFPVSSLDGTGIDALAAHLREQAAHFAARTAGGNFRMAIDRSFTLAGIGTIVAGTVHAGRVAVGDLVEIVPGPQGRRVSARVRSLHAQDRAATSGVAGQRCALNLAGIEKADAPRGDWLQAAGLDNLTTRFDAALSVVASVGAQARALNHLATVHLHHGAEDVLARVAILEGDRIEPGASALVCCMLDRPIAACRGDRFVIRDASATQTLGGGTVLDIASPARGKRTASRLAWLRALRDQAPDGALVLGLSQQPLALARLRSGWNLTEAELDALLAAAQARVAGDSAFGRAAWEALRARALAAVKATHEREPEMAGTEQQRLRRIVAPGLSNEAFAALVDELLADGTLVRRGAFLGGARPSRGARQGRARALGATQAAVDVRSLRAAARARPGARRGHVRGGSPRAAASGGAGRRGDARRAGSFLPVERGRADGRHRGRAGADRRRGARGCVPRSHRRRTQGRDPCARVLRSCRLHAARARRSRAAPFESVARGGRACGHSRRQRCAERQ